MPLCLSAVRFAVRWNLSNKGRTASACAPCTELFTARLFEHLAQLIAKSCCNQLDPSRRFDLRRGSLVHAPVALRESSSGWPRRFQWVEGELPLSKRTKP